MPLVSRDPPRWILPIKELLDHQNIYQSIGKWENYSLTLSFSSHFALLGCIPLKPTWRYSTSPRREVLVLLSRMMSLGNSSRYFGEKSSTVGTVPTSWVSIINGGSYNFKFFTFTTEYICIYIGKSIWKALFSIFSKMVNGPYRIGCNFFPSPFILSLLIWSHTLSPTWNWRSTRCLSCWALYWAWIFSNCSYTTWWINWIHWMNCCALSLSSCPLESSSLPKTISKQSFGR